MHAPSLHVYYLENIRSKRPLDIIDGIEMNLHEGAKVVVAVLAEIELVADPFVIGCVELRQEFRPVIKVIGGTGTKSKTPELRFNVS